MVFQRDDLGSILKTASSARICTTLPSSAAQKVTAKDGASFESIFEDFRIRTSCDWLPRPTLHQGRINLLAMM